MNKYRDVIIALYDRLGYSVDEEIFKVLLSDAQHLLVKAPAGGTKTTISQVFINLEKIKKSVHASIVNRKNGIVESTSYNKENIQTFVYNNHNVNDILNVNNKIYNALENLGLLNSDPNSRSYSSPSISVSTVHGFAYDVISQHMKLFNLRSVKKTSDYVIDYQLSNILGKMLDSPFNVKEYKACYDLYTSLMMYDREDLELVQFKSEALNRDVDFSKLKNIFVTFDLAKKASKFYEYSDWLKMTNTILSNKDIQEYYQNRFKIIVADEIQDFTPLMFSIYSKLISNKTKTLGIGDSDQTIYRFMGASPNNVDNYGDILNIPIEVHNLSVNRRCARNTFFYARNLRNEIKINSDYDITTPRDRGRFIHLTYGTLQEECSLILNEISKISYPTTAILVRGQLDSMLLSRSLYQLGVKVNYINAVPFNQHSLYFNFKNVLYKLIMLRTPETWVELYKILPFSKEQLNKFFNFDRNNNSLNFADVQDWKYIDFSSLVSNSKNRHSVLNQIIFLKGIADNYLNLATLEYIPALIEMHIKNYYQFLLNPTDVYIGEVGKWILEDFSGYNNLRKVRTNLEDLDNLLVFKGNSPITISTIHGAKGLEYDRVILSRMEDSFKTFKSLTQEEIDYNNINLLRLYYVACTRQRDCLVLLSNKYKPFSLLDSRLLVNNYSNIELKEQYNKTSFSQIFNDNDDLLNIKPKFKL